MRLRELRRYESVYAKARHELATSAVNLSLAFAAAGTERGPARHKCLHVASSFNAAWKVTVRAPQAAPRFGEIIVSARPALLECRRLALQNATATSGGSGGGGGGSSSGGGSGGSGGSGSSSSGGGGSSSRSSSSGSSSTISSSNGDWAVGQGGTRTRGGGGNGNL